MDSREIALNWTCRGLLTGIGVTLLLAGCAAAPVREVLPPAQAIPALKGSYYRVRAGDTLWAIARSYGLDVGRLASVNRVPDPRRVEIGQQLFIPLPEESSRFLWPVRGKYSRANVSDALVFAVPAGSSVRAARSGRVAVATERLSGWGKTVILDHGDGYLSVYSGLEQILVRPGMAVRQGVSIGSVGLSGLHFEIRHGTRAKDPLSLLPT